MASGSKRAARDGTCPDHTHPRGEGVVARAERICRDERLQLTPMRRRVLEAIAGEDRALGAYDIAERLSVPGRRVAAVSVYRAIDFLLEHGLVHRIASRNAFVSCGHGHTGGEGAVFLICRSCGHVDETVAPDVDSSIDRALARSGFHSVSRIVEVEGECLPCREGRQHAAH